MAERHVIDHLTEKFGFDFKQRKSEHRHFLLRGGNSYDLDENGNIISVSFVSNNAIKEFDILYLIDVLSELNSLRSLTLAGFGMNDIAALSKLKKITTLNLSENNITDIEPLLEITSLTELYLSNNKVSNIDLLQKLPHLKDLYALRNKIQNIDSIINFPSLRKINLSNNIINNLNIFSYPIALSSAWFYNNKIENIENKCYSKTLMRLGIGRNNISNLDFLQNFQNLKELQLIDNNITDISPLRYLPDLISLTIGNNKITDISVLKNHHKLTKLAIANNEIKDPSPIKELVNLNTLDITNNKIKDLEFIMSLTKLSSLNLAGNKIEEIPKWLLEYHLPIVWNPSRVNLNSVNLYKNPINNIPIEILTKGNKSIIRYFEKLANEGKDYIYEAKLIFVGEGSAGKTSLQKRLISEKAILPKKDKRTRGIELRDWVFKKEKNKRHIAHIWDFGGQDVYYPVHRFFITENSVFVLLASTRQTHHNFDYWIPTIYQFGGNSPIIIGQTCHEGNRISWNDLGMFLSNINFNIIKTQEIPYYEINLSNQNNGLSKIRSVIEGQIMNLPHYGRGVPKSWVVVRNTLNQISKDTPCISFEYFQEICSKSDFEISPTSSDVSDCCQFLHDIGVVLWYAKTKELKNWVILQPEWAMNAVYKIIDDIDIQERKGNIVADDFQRLWKENFYVERRDILKNMLEIFKIAFPKKHKQEDYIIPARLLSMPSEERWTNEEPFLQIEYKYEFMPRGLVNQISAELSKYITKEEEVWNNAVNFYFTRTQARCQVIEDFYNRKITIKASGKDARSMMILVMNALDDLNETYKGVNAEINVPCICNNCINAETPNMFIYNKLLDWSTNKDAIVCNESGDTIMINDLLYNIGLPNFEASNKNDSMKKTVVIFLASSSELKEDREQFEIFINRENKKFIQDGIFIHLEIWEDFIDAMSSTRLQDEYNKSIRNCDIFVSLFFNKVGIFTEEEFSTALENFTNNGKPLIYTYFKEGSVPLSSVKVDDVISKAKFQDRIKVLGHFPTYYNNIDELKFHFKGQLEKILPTIL